MNWTTLLSWIVGTILVAGILAWSLARSVERGKLILKWVVTVFCVGAIWTLFTRWFGIGALLASMVFVCILIVTWTSSLAFFFTAPLLRLFFDEGDEIEPAPAYSTAEAKRKRGQYADAVEAVEEQLDQFPNDLYGTLLLARIQAEDMDDVNSGIKTLEAFVKRTDTSNAVVALNQIADWRLALNEDLTGARRALQDIQTLCPGTEAAYTAGQRLAHLANTDAVEAVQHPQPIHYREFPRPARVGEVLDVRPKPVDPAEEASGLVAHLEKHPTDFEARERLAALYADHFKRMDLARMQMEELIGNPEAPRRQVIHWLNRLADLEIRGAQDIDAAHAALQRIINLDPKVAAAEQARRRMGLLVRELKRYTP